MKLTHGFVILATVASLLLGACISPDTPTARAISNIESRTLLKDADTYRIVTGLGDILHLIPPAYPSDWPVTPLAEILFWTTPRATFTPRICQADLVSFDFTPARFERPRLPEHLSRTAS